MVTTKDNPFDPFEDYDEWNRYDQDKGYNTQSYLSRLSASRIARAKSLLSKGYSQSDVADMLDISVSTLVKSIGPENM